MPQHRTDVLNEAIQRAALQAYQEVAQAMLQVPNPLGQVPKEQQEKFTREFLQRIAKGG